jgi:hypothetical protein
LGLAGNLVTFGYALLLMFHGIRYSIRDWDPFSESTVRGLELLGLGLGLGLLNLIYYDLRRAPDPPPPLHVAGEGEFSRTSPATNARPQT